jgi:hypothetical protein
MKKYVGFNSNYPFSIKPCSMSYSQNDGDYEIMYNGTDFEIVPINKSKKEDTTFNRSDWETEWLDDWNIIEKDLTEKNCVHEWKATQLVYSTVYDCIKCGMKKEENK